jgi:hypothetical protein
MTSANLYPFFEPGVSQPRLNREWTSLADNAWTSYGR